ncbi:MAG TPA: squalene--hopene cyclase [Vicinamibacterales bacterium]|nr:squalene--hopene cyclase [Vicinamibacterales bacterium]
MSLPVTLRDRPLDQPAIGIEQAHDAVVRGRECLLSIQTLDGYWLGELGADTTLESDYIFYLSVLGRTDPIGKLANRIRGRQLPDGGWNIYQEGPSELNATVKAFFALKLAGDAAGAPHMVRARQRVLELGGVERTNAFARFYLALAGVISWDMVPAIPPELLLMPRWLPLNIYEMSAWTRAIVVPLTILYTHKLRWRAPDCARIDELFCDVTRSTVAFERDSQLLTRRNAFLVLNRAARVYERLPWRPFRRYALQAAEHWLLEHLERSDGLAAIYPAMMNAVLALVAVGRHSSDPLTARQIDRLAELEIEDPDSLRLQPCLSAVWDTAVAMVAVEEAGIPRNHPSLIKAARWLLDRQILGAGDWQVTNPGVRPGGWPFELRNDFYPDVDDTAFVLQALQQVAYPDQARLDAAMEAGLAWMVGMQNDDGGWGAFDRNNDCTALTQVPFADHNAMIDPSTADVTARVLECLGRFGYRVSDPVIARGLEFLRREQTADGAWYGRWGVNYIYGTSGVLRALEALGIANLPLAKRAVAWLRTVQNPDGGFGESCESYADASKKGQGRSTPSQTAWGLIGLLAACSVTDPAVRRAATHLIDRQNPDGTWDEDATTGTGFPLVFYLRYDLYRQSFPVYALARYARLASGAPRPGAMHIISPSRRTKGE